MANQLARLDPGKLEWQIEQASAQSNLGVVKLRTGAATEAQEHFQAAADIWTALVAQRQDLREEFATTLGWLAEAQEYRGLFDLSAATQRMKLALLLGPESPRDKHAEHLRASTEAALARLSLSAGRLDHAEESARRARDIYYALAALDPGNLDMQARLGLARQQLAEVMIYANKLPDARAELATLAPIIRSLLAADRPRPDWRLRLQGRWLAARLAVASSESERATASYALKQYLAAMDGQSPTDPRDAMVLADAGRILGDAEPAHATELWHAALSRLDSLIASKDEPNVTCLRASLLARMGRAQEARVLVENLDANNFRHPLLVQLRKRLAP
jgi:tetratricopeptide (TPR) repeat protein